MLDLAFFFLEKLHILDAFFKQVLHNLKQTQTNKCTVISCIVMAMFKYIKTYGSHIE